MEDEKVGTLKRWGEGALVLGLFLIVWVGVVHGFFVWVTSAALGFFTFGGSNEAAKDYANTIAVFSLVVSALVLLWMGFLTVRNKDTDRAFEALLVGWIAGAVFVILFWVLSWFAAGQLPSPEELGKVVGIFATAAAFLAAVGHAKQ